MRRLLVLVSLLALLPERASSGENAFRLRHGARGDVCLECHGLDFDAVLKMRFVHTPVRAKNCAGCHNPHTSGRRNLLGGDPGQSCSACHRDIAPAKPASAHPPVANGQCTVCHDPHASAFKFNLVKSPAELCAGCHPDVAQVARGKFPHAPVEQGCTVCHAPHGSARAPSLLAAKVPDLCIGCHGTDQLASRHMGYPVARTRCTSCHDPHGSNVAGLLHATVHPPVARRNCSQCHYAPTSPRPFETKRIGVLLCRTCHVQRIAAMFDKNRVHWPVARGECLACHAPHASNQRGLVKANMVRVCGACHADTVRRQALSATKHQPIEAGACTRCHDPHGSQAPLMFASADVTTVCQSCHDWQKHSNHPLGARYRDPRNANLTVNCLACHRAHGTEYRHLLPYASKELCTSCHTSKA